MKIFFDTEFMEDGKTIDLLSIGLVREDGVEYYAEALEVDKTKANAFVIDNVFPYLRGPIKTRGDIKADVVAFCGQNPEFWADYCSYDWVVLCQLFGDMLQIPSWWPHYCNDIQTLKRVSGYSGDLPITDGTEHHALDDAKEVYDRYYFLQGVLKVDSK